MRRIFVDIDGTLAYWNPDVSFDDVCSPGYFSNLEPMKNMITFIEKLKDMGYPIYIISAVIDGERYINEKIGWLHKNLPWIPDDNIIFSTYGGSKTDAILMQTGYIEPDDILFDDYTVNLNTWHGTSIKVMNGLNGSKGTWQGNKIRGYLSSRNIMEDFSRIVA